MSSLRSFLTATALCSVVAGSASAEAIYGGGGNPCDGWPTLTCYLSPTASSSLEGVPSNVTGSALFTPEVQSGCSSEPDVCVARIKGTIYGLGDATPHGWHVHEFADISKPDGTGTGGHFNPFGTPHALPPTKPRHTGDIGNLHPDDSGVAYPDYTDNNLDLSLAAGRGLIVHAAEDDGGQPTGNAGARLAQCVLGVVASSE